MFDNEIDWVTRLECCEPAVRRAERRKIRERIHTRPSTSNESAMIQASVQSKKSVFRSCSRTHVNAIELLSRRITGTNSGRTEVIQLPALELILWSSYKGRTVDALAETGDEG